MDNLLKDIREAERLGYGVHYGHYKADHPHTADASLDLEPEPVLRKCEECGAEFVPTKENQKYCCSACKKRVNERTYYRVKKAKLPAGPAVCPTCCKSFDRKTRQIYCCRSCAATARSLKRRKQGD